MEEKSNSNIDFLDMTRNGKEVISLNKAKWEFTKRYTFLFLACLTIYRIVFRIVERIFQDEVNFEATITDAKNYIDIVSSQSNILSIICISLILCNFLIVIISSLNFFNKYSIKKDYYKSLLKTIIIIEIIFVGVTSFYFTVRYIGNSTNLGDRSRLETLTGYNDRENKMLPREKEELKQKIDGYIGKLNNIYLIHFIVLMIGNILCAISCVVIQSKIIKENGEIVDKCT